MNRQKYLAELPDRIDQSLEEMSTLVRFWTAMNKREPLSMRSFEDLANRAFAILAIDSDLTEYPRWRVRDSNLESCLPEGVPTLEQILEGDARFGEHQALALIGGTPAAWEGWRSRFIAGTYAPTYDWLLRELGNAEVSRVAIEIALTGPIDLTCGDAAKDGLVYVEDCLPGSRRWVSPQTPSPGPACRRSPRLLWGPTSPGKCACKRIVGGRRAAMIKGLPGEGMRGRDSSSRPADNWRGPARDLPS